MNTTITHTFLHCWNSFIKNFLIAVALGLLGGATLSTMAHATPARSPSGTLPAGENPLGKPASEKQNVACAGKIRQQAQRIAKLYLQIGMGLEVANARQQLSNAAQQIDNDLLALGKQQMDARTLAGLERVTQSWNEMKRDFNAPFTPDSRTRVFGSADALSQLSGTLAASFERTASEPGSGLLDLSLRQSMLVQRLARLYLMAYSGDKSIGLQVDIEQARREFSSALNELTSTNGNSEASRRALELTKMQWIFFERAIDTVKSPRDSKPSHVASTSEQILELLDEVSAQYVQDKI